MNLSSCCKVLINLIINLLLKLYIISWIINTLIIACKISYLQSKILNGKKDKTENRLSVNEKLANSSVVASSLEGSIRFRRTRHDAGSRESWWCWMEPSTRIPSGEFTLQFTAPPPMTNRRSVTSHSTSSAWTSTTAEMTSRAECNRASTWA